MHARLTRLLMFVAPILLFFANGSWAEDDFLQNKEYQLCLQLTRTSPEQAFETALSWQELGGGPAAKHCLAVALFELEQFPEAASRLEELAQHMPDKTPSGIVADILGHAGVAWMMAGENGKAYAAQTSALELSPMNPSIRTDRAMVLFDAGKYAESIDDLNAAIDTQPDQPDILIFRASANRQIDQFELALKDLNQALTLDPTNPEGLLERGMIYRLTGKTSAARTDWLKLIELHDGRPAAETAKRNIELLDLKN